MTVLAWCDPPEGLHRWSKRLQPVMERPGEWAMVMETQSVTSVRSTVKHFRNGTTVIPPGRWVFRTGKSPMNAGHWGVWAKYLGPEDEL